jgi:hypothetical protein
MKDNLNFYISTSQKCKFDELKLMLGFQIQIRLDPDLFDWIRVLQGAMAVVANPVDLISLMDP